MSPSALKPFGILALYFFIYQWCGVNTITFYAVEVFEVSISIHILLITETIAVQGQKGETKTVNATVVGLIPTRGNELLFLILSFLQFATKAKARR